MSFGDRIFLSMALLVVIGLLWIKYVGDTMPLLWGALAVWAILVAIINKFAK